MFAENFDLAAYFQRIGYTGPVEQSLETLHDLMRTQLFAVPFENLDVQAGQVVSMVPEQIVEKIVQQRRGGYCYEVNGLFAMALQALGFSYRFVAARPMFYPVRRPKTHMVLLVEAEGEQYLLDLGFGSYGIRAPIALSQLDTELEQDFDRFKLTLDDKGAYVLQAKVDGQWLSQFGFDGYESEWVDFMPANYLNSTHPDTIFVQKLLVIRHSPQGRDILLGDQLKQIRAEGTQVRQLSEAERGTELQRLLN
ncbi:arylamine N-acetyltransferase family protein [Rheinheimera sp.]|uniref:arylamine N-acetyltransferase family protein n=1 Tax=Rheinheimera sp. TaxID=1869214 RepID=UPI003AF7DCF0